MSKKKFEKTDMILSTLKTRFAPALQTLVSGTVYGKRIART